MNGDTEDPSHSHLEFASRLRSGDASVGVIGLGYVGLPLAVACAGHGFRVVGFDIDADKIAQLSRRSSYVGSISSADLGRLVESGRFRASADFAELSDCDVIVMCVPTPLSRHREPDLRFVEATTKEIAGHLRRGQLIVLESTSYPGTTEEVVKPILEATGLKSGKDFYLGFSPEREDPGNARFRTTTIPKVYAGDGQEASLLMEAFYGAFVETVVGVSSTKTAEAVKITENVFRAVNIALVNELKVIYAAMGIDIWEVIDAAATKPFGYMPFYPGPGLGGHCIPIDPFYLTWKSREFGLVTRFVELAGEINISMPRYVIGRLEDALDRFQHVSLGSAHVLIIGLAYKRNVPDIRESPSFGLMEILTGRGTNFEFHDPLVPTIPSTREHSHFAGRQSVALSPESLRLFNAVIVSTDHDAVDYKLVTQHARLIVDTRNVFARNGIMAPHIVKA